MERIDTVKTLNVLALAFLAGHFLLDQAWFAWVAAALVLGGAFEFRWASWIAGAWLRFAAALGVFNSRLILSVVFFCVLTPVALLFRRFNGDLVAHFRNRKRQSCFDDVRRTYRREDFEKLW